ncbi:MAG: zinc-ribbon domain-containing protein [Alphaproteobacteria bacterium]|nr:zinc-ribbon domain-containing protein [Alphaproteobacteria bacterium]
MQIVCPNCSTSYQIADVAIGASGRSVRCARCQNQWRVALQAASEAVAGAPADEADSIAAFRAELGTAPPEPAETEPAPESAQAAEPLPGDPAVDQAPAEIEAPGIVPVADISAADAPAADTPADPEVEAEAAVALSDIPIPFEQAPPLVPNTDDDGTSGRSAEMENGSPDVESVAARRPRTKARRKRSRWRIPLPALIAALVLLSAGLLGLRKEIVRYAPQLASFYRTLGLPVNLRGVAFTDLKIGNEIHDGVPVLVIEGMIVSMVSKPVDVPRMRFALRSSTGAEVYSWTAPPAQEVLGPFEALPFRTRLASPPADGHDIQVRFFTRRDAVAGLQ